MSDTLNLPLAHQWRAGDGLHPPALLVLMHGVGSHADDLFQLAPYVPRHAHVLSLQAPYALGPGAHAWFEFDVLPDGSRRIHADQEARSRALVAKTVQAAGRQLGVEPERIVVGGFSQGGIMALSLLRTEPELLHAAMVLHGRWLHDIDGASVAPERTHAKTLWISHGRQDNVIPLALAHDMRHAAFAMGLTLTYQEFDGAHEIRPDELRAAMAWLARQW